MPALIRSDAALARCFHVWAAWARVDHVKSAPDQEGCVLLRDMSGGSKEHLSGKGIGLYPQVRVDTSKTSAVGQCRWCTPGRVLLVETLRSSGLDLGLSAGLAPWRKPAAAHDPAKIICDLALSLAVGGDCLADVGVLRSEPGVYGRIASDPTVYRTITALAADLSAVLAAVDSARAQARQRDTQKNHQARWAPDDLVSPHGTVSRCGISTFAATWSVCP